MAKVLIIAADGTAIDHLDYSYMRMLEEGLDVTIAAPEKRDLKTTVHWGEPGEYLYTVERPGYTVPSHIAFDDVDPTQYDGLLIPGGRAPEYIRTNQRCLDIIRHFLDSGKPVSATCHGPLLLLAAGVTGKKMTCTDDTRADVEVYGNTYLPARGAWENEPDHIRDGNIVTARGWFHWHDWVREFLNMLEERGLHKRVRKSARVLILAGDHSSSGQAGYGYERMCEEGFDVALAAPRKGVMKTIIDQREEGWDMKPIAGLYDFETIGFELWATHVIDEIDPAQYDGLLLPGGRGPEYLRNIPANRNAVQHFIDSDKPIGAICQGVRYLLANGVKGRQLTGPDYIRTEIEQGNRFVAATSEPVIDGNILTVSGRPHYHVWVREFLKMLP